MDSSIVVLLLITVVGSVLVTWLLPKAFHSEPPYGTAADILVGTIAGVIWAVIAYQFLAPLIGMEGWGALLLSAGDAIGLAAVMLWILRRIKR
jgi:hydrogenase-4 membrane subunit HyfE